MHDERKILEKLSMLGKKLEDEPNNLPQIINEYQAYFEGIRDNEEDESVIQEMNQLISMFSGLAGIADAGSKLSKLENLVEPFSELMEQLKMDVEQSPSRAASARNPASVPSPSHRRLAACPRRGPASDCHRAWPET